MVKNAAIPLAQTDKIVMYGDGNSTRLIKDVMSSASQVMDGMKESTGIDLQALLAGMVGGRLAAAPSAPAPAPMPAPAVPSDTQETAAAAMKSEQEGSQQV